MLISFARTRSPPAEQPEILADGFVLALLICMLICMLTGFYRPEPSAATGTGSQWPLASQYRRRFCQPSCGAVGTELVCFSFLLIRFSRPNPRPWAVRGVCSQFGLDHLAGTRHYCSGSMLLIHFVQSGIQGR